MDSKRNFEDDDEETDGGVSGDAGGGDAGGDAGGDVGGSPLDAATLRSGTLDELDALDDEEGVDLVADARARLSVAELLHRLVDRAQGVEVRDLFVLSDLSRGETEEVEEAWPRIDVEGRRRIVAALVESAAENIELQLGRVLRIALRDGDPAVRRSAIEGLWEEADPSLIGPFVQMMNKDPDVGVRAAAAAALGAYMLAGELDEIDAALAMRAEESLLNVLNNGEEPLRVRCRALESLAYSSEEGLRQLIEDAYYSPQDEMRLSAVRAMGRSADTRWRSMARAELDSPEAAMRAEAARACGELEAKSATAQIIDMLEDRDVEVRLAAIEALGHLGGKAAREALRTVAEEAEEDEAQAAEDALEEMLFYGEPGSAPLYEVEDEDDEGDDIEPWRSTSQWDD